VAAKINCKIRSGPRAGISNAHAVTKDNVRFYFEKAGSGTPVDDGGVTVIASEAKQSMPQQAERWIASLRSQ
jgi:hypothetical protein